MQMFGITPMWDSYIEGNKVLYVVQKFQEDHKDIMP